MRGSVVSVVGTVPHELTHYGVKSEESRNRHAERSLDAFCRDGVEACSTLKTRFGFAPLRYAALSVTRYFIVGKLAWTHCCVRHFQ